MTDATQNLLDRMSALEKALENPVLTGQCDDVETSDVQDVALAGEVTAQFLWYRHLAVNYGGGIRLLRSGNPLRATRVTVYVNDCKYRVHGGTGGTIYTPTGNGGYAGSSFRYPGFHRYGVVMYLPGTSFTFNITGTSASTAQTFNISNGADIYFNVNDTTGSGHYGDNWGAYNVWIRVDQA